MPDLVRVERLARSTILALPFVATNRLTRYEIFGRENLLGAIERQRSTGRGLITVSNHQSLFDDPLIFAALLDLTSFNVENKIWWSTPCQTNFSPEGKRLRDRFVRYFSDVSNMVFFTRRGKNGHLEVPSRYLEALAAAGRSELCRRITARAEALGMDGESYLRRFVTAGRQAAMAPLNQLGMVEACARVDLGDWLHFFPEGGRSRKLELGSPKRGVGKVIYHCPEAEVLPLCFCGMHDVLPVGARLPRPLRRVVVFVGEPVAPRKLAALRGGPAGPDCFQKLAALSWEPIESLWPLALARYQKQRPLVTPFELVPRWLRAEPARKILAPMVSARVPAAGRAAASPPPAH